MMIKEEARASYFYEMNKKKFIKIIFSCEFYSE